MVVKGIKFFEVKVKVFVNFDVKKVYDEVMQEEEFCVVFIEMKKRVGLISIEIVVCMGVS